jgi:orotate phosphoribosyltransferase
VVIEDLISTGQSSLGAVDALEEAELQVKGMLAIFSYGFDLSAQRFKDRNLSLHTLSNYEYLISQASRSGYVSETQLQTLEAWRSNPEQWNP